MGPYLDSNGNFIPAITIPTTLARSAQPLPRRQKCRQLQLETM
jgi:hypothetical protein